MTRLQGMLALAAIAVVGAGCGSNAEQNDYVDQLNGLQDQLVDDVTAVVSGAAPTNPQQAADVAGDLEQVFDASADEIAGIETPDEVADLHAQLVAQVRGVADQIANAREAFTGGSAQEAAQAAVELQQASGEAETKLNSLVDQINAELGN